MKKLFLTLILSLAFLFPAMSFAQEAIGGASTNTTITPTANKTLRSENKEAREAKISQVADKQVNDLKARGDKEIERRITALNKLIDRISKIKKITDAQKSELTSKVQAEIDALNALKAKIDADTDFTTLKTDVKSIVDSYRVFVVFMPQIQLLGAADRLYILSADLATVSTKLTTRINNAKSLGKDVTEVNAWLTDLKSKTEDINTLANSITTEVLSLTPEGYPENKSTILDARSKLQTATKDLLAAKMDAKNIIGQLKAWVNEFPKPSITPTPSI